MINTIQLALGDPVYAAVLRDALTRSGPWNIVSVQMPDPRQKGVLVLDENALERLPLPLPNPERIVLVTHKDPQHLSAAWDAGIVSLVSVDDPPNTVMLAIMAAALRVQKAQAAAASGSLNPSAPQVSARITPDSRPPCHKRHKTQ
jgi:DNA-binding NarL/FixJ family response regulator